MSLLEKITSYFKITKFEGTAELKTGEKQLRIEGGDMAEGAKVFIITKDGDIPMPDGEWELNNNYTITTAEGMIVSVIETETETEVEAPVVEEVIESAIDNLPVEQRPDEPETEPQPEEEPTEETSTTDEKVAELETKITDLTTKVDEILTKLDSMSASYSKTIDEVKDEMNMRFEKVSTTPQIKKLDKETSNNIKQSPYIGSYKDLKKS